MELSTEPAFNPDNTDAKNVLKSAQLLEDEFKLRFKEIRPHQNRGIKGRHGHRSVIFNDEMLVLGGGNDGVVYEICSFNFVNNKWSALVVKGNFPAAFASFGLVNYNNKYMVVFGGIDDYRNIQNSVHILEPNSNNVYFQWTRPAVQILPPLASPTLTNNEQQKNNKFYNVLPRFGHSFVYEHDEGSAFCAAHAFMFGGITSSLNDVSLGCIRFLNDLYACRIDNKNKVVWRQIRPRLNQLWPSGRESHSAVLSYKNNNYFMYVFGGFNGCERMNDLWRFDIATFEWTFVNLLPNEDIVPRPRSVHSSVMYNDKIIIFAGWTNSNFATGNPNQKMKNAGFYGGSSGNYLENYYCTTCCSDLDVFDVRSGKWYRFGPILMSCSSSNTSSFQQTTLLLTDNIGIMPQPRAGHSMLVHNNRIYVFSGREGFRKARTGIQSCHSDLWLLDCSLPAPPNDIVIVCCNSNSIFVRWDKVRNADFYLVQVFADDKWHDVSIVSSNSCVIVEYHMERIDILKAFNGTLTMTDMSTIKPNTCYAVMILSINNSGISTKGKPKVIITPPFGLTQVAENLYAKQESGGASCEFFWRAPGEEGKKYVYCLFLLVRSEAVTARERELTIASKITDGLFLRVYSGEENRCAVDKGLIERCGRVSEDGFYVFRLFSCKEGDNERFGPCVETRLKLRNS